MDIDTKDRNVSIEFFDKNTQRHMKYIYPGTSTDWAGWIFFKHPDGQWVSLRKATDADIEKINKAVVEAHHEGDEG